MFTLLKIKHEVARQAPLFPAKAAIVRLVFRREIQNISTFSFFTAESVLSLRAAQRPRSQHVLSLSFSILFLNFQIV